MSPGRDSMRLSAARRRYLAGGWQRLAVAAMTLVVAAAGNAASGPFGAFRSTVAINGRTVIFGAGDGGELDVREWNRTAGRYDRVGVAGEMPARAPRAVALDGDGAVLLIESGGEVSLWRLDGSDAPAHLRSVKIAEWPMRDEYSTILPISRGRYIVIGAGSAAIVSRGRIECDWEFTVNGRPQLSTGAAYSAGHLLTGRRVQIYSIGRSGCPERPAIEKGTVIAQQVAPVDDGWLILTPYLGRPRLLRLDRALKAQWLLALSSIWLMDSVGSGVVLWTPARRTAYLVRNNRISELSIRPGSGHVDLVFSKDPRAISFVDSSGVITAHMARELRPARAVRFIGGYVSGAAALIVFGVIAACVVVSAFWWRFRQGHAGA